LPKDGPHITGEEKQYHQIGDEISLNCTSGKSYPASELQWFINDEQVTSPDALVSYPNLVHQHGLLVSTLGLRFTVTSSHFVEGSMTVRCVASVSPILWQGDRESVVQRVSPLIENNIREALLLVKGSSSQCSASVVMVAVMTSLLLSTVT
ncbi:uncharacterized protein LOC110838519, partial [Zootermopsis nevadensis]|uniref:uncharacterized protein LOC110838519 n=1 Tax=Zootermopsis nevadensis TaxID=136037 RepID=UPI000B8EAC69